MSGVDDGCVWCAITVKSVRKAHNLPTATERPRLHFKDQTLIVNTFISVFISVFIKIRLP